MPMARVNISFLTAYLIGRSAKCGEVKISVAICGSVTTTDGAEAESHELCLSSDGSQARKGARWARPRPRVRVKRPPKTGIPLGSWMGTRPLWFLPFFHAIPPLAKAHERRPRDANVIRKVTSTKMSHAEKIALPRKARSVTHQLVPLLLGLYLVF